MVLTYSTTTHSTKIVEHRGFFDSFRPITSKDLIPLTPSEPTRVNICPSTSYAVQLPKLPDTPKSWSDLKTDPNKEYWYNATMERYTKKFRVGLWSAPYLRENIPNNSVVIHTTYLSIYRKIHT